MTLLHNRLNKESAMKLIEAENFRRRTASFYRYVQIDDAKALRDQLYQEWSEPRVLGRIYIAAEGINAQLCVPEPHWDEFVAKLNTHPEFKDMLFKIAVEGYGQTLGEPAESFWKLTIKVKHQIVADGLSSEDYEVTNVGTELQPEEFNKALEEGAICVDMRNHYESRIGKFKGALTPDCDTFREELPMVKEMLKGKENEKVILYCTGGIRCEKASAYLKGKGFTDVNQLHGGIINYAHEMAQKQQQSKFIGKNFVFDDRIAERITDDVIAECDQCKKTCDDYTNCSNKMCNLLFIQCEACSKETFNTCSSPCEEIARLPIEEQRKIRKGLKHSFQRFKKQMRPGLKKLTF